jgi:hypothetical protein
MFVLLQVIPTFDPTGINVPLAFLASKLSTAVVPAATHPSYDAVSPSVSVTLYDSPSLHTHTHIHTYMLSQTHTFTFTYTHINTPIHPYAHTHAHYTAQTNAHLHTYSTEKRTIYCIPLLMLLCV